MIALMVTVPFNTSGAEAEDEGAAHPRPAPLEIGRRDVGHQLLQ